MKLLVFPGVGSPENPIYAEVYSLIEEGAKRFGFGSIKICYWPGQIEAEEDELTLDGAVNVAKQKIQEAENDGEPYCILGRSFGTIVCAKTLSEISVSKFKSIILWGPPPFPVLWELFKRDFEKTKLTAEQKGTRISDRFFDSITPLETLIPNIKHPTVIATGTEDKYCRPYFISYLKKLVNNTDNLSLRVVNGAPHEVTHESPKVVIEEYQQKLLNEKYPGGEDLI